MDVWDVCLEVFNLSLDGVDVCVDCGDDVINCLLLFVVDGRHNVVKEVMSFFSEHHIGRKLPLSPRFHFYC